MNQEMDMNAIWIKESALQKLNTNILLWMVEYNEYIAYIYEYVTFLSV